MIGQPAPRDHYRTGYPFDLVVTLYADAQPAPWEVEEIRYGFPDSKLTPNAARQAVSLSAYAYTRWQAGARVLIRCQAGVNRSGLVTALVLMRDGHPADAAIELIQAKRSPVALSNEHFTKWLIEKAAAQLDLHRGGGTTRPGSTDDAASTNSTNSTNSTTRTAGRASTTGPAAATATAA